MPEGDVIDQALLAQGSEHWRGGTSGVLGAYIYMYPEPGEYIGLVETSL
ncbi:MAG: hypothetical protein QXP98_02810 [Thermoproteus sp.]